MVSCTISREVNKSYFSSYIWSQRERKKGSEKEQLTEDQILKKKLRNLILKNIKGLKDLSGKIIVDVSFNEGQEYYLTISPEDKQLLEDKTSEITDSIVFICLRFALDYLLWWLVRVH